MTLGQFISILRARWWVAVLMLALVVIATLAVSLILPKQYTARASVVIDVKPDPISAVFGGLGSPSYMATQVDIIQSDRVAQLVVRNLKLAENPQVRDQWLEATGGAGSFDVWMANALQLNLDVKPSLASNVITVSYKGQEPRFAAGLANAFVQAYIETALQLKVDPAKQYTSFFDSRGQEAREALEKAQAKLSAFQREKGIIATDERADIENARLNELSSQLVALQAVAAESSTRQGQAQGASADKMQEVLSNPIISTLKSDLARQEARLQELSARLGDAHPQVVELKANSAEVRVKIAEETKRVTGGVGVTSNINRAREAQLRAALDTQRDKVLRMRQVRDEGLVLAREVESAQRAYDALMARSTQTGLESQTTQGNAYLLTAADPPTEASSPKVVLNTVLAALLGVLLAVSAVLVMELVDRRVRTVDDIVQALGLPVLGTMPRAHAKRFVAGRHVPSLANQRLVGLPAPLREA